MMDNNLQTPICRHCGLEMENILTHVCPGRPCPSCAAKDTRIAELSERNAALEEVAEAADKVRLQHEKFCKQGWEGGRRLDATCHCEICAALSAEGKEKG